MRSYKDSVNPVHAGLGKWKYKNENIFKRSVNGDGASIVSIAITEAIVLGQNSPC